MVYGSCSLLTNPFNCRPKNVIAWSRYFEPPASPAGLVRRARVLLLLADGVSHATDPSADQDEPATHSAVEEELANEGTGRSAGRRTFGTTEEADRGPISLPRMPPHEVAEPNQPDRTQRVVD
jgi:hypothetical protein